MSSNSFSNKGKTNIRRPAIKSGELDKHQVMHRAWRSKDRTSRLVKLEPRMDTSAPVLCRSESMLISPGVENFLLTGESRGKRREEGGGEQVKVRQRSHGLSKLRSVTRTCSEQFHSLFIAAISIRSRMRIEDKVEIEEAGRSDGSLGQRLLGVCTGDMEYLDTYIQGRKTQHNTPSDFQNPSARTGVETLSPGRFSRGFITCKTQNCCNCKLTSLTVFTLPLSDAHSVIPVSLSLPSDKLFVLQLAVWGLRGVTRVILANNPLSGALVLAALYWASPWQGLLGTVGILASTLTAVIIGQDRWSTNTNSV